MKISVTKNLKGWTTIYDAVRKPNGLFDLDGAKDPLWRPDGKVLYDDHNLITTFGKTRAAQLLGGIDVNFINAMAIGDEGAPVASPSTPYIPLATDTGLSNELARTTLVNPIIVGSNQLRFTALFLTAPPLAFANILLKAINEVGLFFQDDVQPGTPRIFARNTFPSIPFDTVDREGVIVTWTITIV
jgi:hypothetical protein